MAEVTIIIPAYNIKNYIGRCLKSVINQSISDFDVLLIDDGSTDGTGTVCDEYQRQDLRIHTLHKPNGGLSDARNYGIDHLPNDTVYVTFIDGDDWVSPFYLEHMLNAIKMSDADIASGFFLKVYEGEQVRNKPNRQLHGYMKLPNVQYLKCMLYQAHTEISAWAKLYKRNIIENLRYPKGKLYEDIPVTYQAVKDSTSVAVFDNIDYYYFQHKSSIQNMDFNIRKMDGIDFMHKLMIDVKKKYPQLSKAAECRYISFIYNILFQIPEMGIYDKIILKLWNEIKHYRLDVIMDKQARKKTRVACMLSYMGRTVLKKIYCLQKK